MFVTYPTIAVIGRDNSTIHHLFKYSTTPLTIDSSWFAYISHELGHYYFGKYSANSNFAVDVKEYRILTKIIVSELVRI